MQKHPNRLWFLALLLGWLFDFLFWKHQPGAQFFIFIVLILAGGLALLYAEDIRPARSTLILLPFILFFAGVTFTRVEGLTVFLGYALALFLLAGLAATFRGGQWWRYSIADYAVKALQLAGSVIALAGITWFQARPPHNGESARAGRASRTVWPVVRGILVAVPVLAFFTALLSSADVVFARRVQDFVELFRLENLPEYIFRTIYILIMAYMLAGALLHAARKSADERLLGLEKPLLTPFFGFTEAAIVLGSVVALFALFVAVQFQYFFGGQSNITAEGFTYAEYARRGFGELVSVAFFSLLLFLGLGTVVRREHKIQHRIFAGLGVALTALVGVMLISAFHRLVLYESAYGFTRLRTYTHVFIIWLGLLLVATVVLDVLRKQRAFALAALIAALGFALNLSLLNVDAFITRSNIARAQAGFDLDVGYLAVLSADATPVMVGLYQSPALSDATRMRVGAALACKLHYDAAPEPNWRAFNLSRWQSQRALEPLASDLRAAYAQTGLYGNQVTAPGGVVYNCYSYQYD